MRCGSLFSGIGGMDHGLAKAGFTHEFFCESDPWRREILARHWPGVPVYEDVVRVRESAERSAADRLRPPVDDGRGETGTGLPDDPDLLCGGFPCQDVSVAGRRAGLAGERSGLFFEFARIVDAVRPRWLLVENVPGLLSSNDGRDFGVVLGTLADLGYGVGYRVLDSRFFGVPQRRRRVYVVGTVADGDPRGAAERAGQVLAVGSRCRRHPPSGTAPEQDVAGTLGGGSGSRGFCDDLERSGAFVTAFHVTQDPISGTISPAMSKGNRQGTGTIGVGTREGVRRLTPTECARLQGMPDTWLVLESDYADKAESDTAQVLHRLWFQIGAQAVEEWKAGVASPLLTPEVLLAGVHGGWVSWEVAARCAEARRSLPGKDAWPEGFVLGLRRADSDRSSPYRRESFEQLGRELGRPVSELPLEEAQTIASLLGAGMRPQASQEWNVRHARPASEERDADGQARSAAPRPRIKSADSRRYAALGDAVTSSVAEWIGRRIKGAS